FLQATDFTRASRANGASRQETPPTLHIATNVFHLLEARALIEVQIVGLAVERRRVEDLLPVRRALEGLGSAIAGHDVPALVEHDVAFHVEIARLTGNTVLFGLEQQLMEQVRHYLMEMRWTPEKFEANKRSHATLFAALVEGDRDKACREMQEHGQLAYRS